MSGRATLALAPTPMTEPCLSMLPEHQPPLIRGTTRGPQTGSRYLPAWGRPAAGWQSQGRARVRLGGADVCKEQEQGEQWRGTPTGGGEGNARTQAGPDAGCREGAGQQPRACDSPGTLESLNVLSTTAPHLV